MIGETLGPFRITEQIGTGGMATVFKAYEPGIDRYVALKLLPAEYYKDPQFRTRFEREARAIARLEHLHILPVYSYGEDRGHMYMVTRLMTSGSLSDYIRRQGPLPFAEAARLLTQIGAALDYAHQRGILHRDVKPGNVLLDEQGNAYLTDFGIAKIVEDASLTNTGVMMGTPAYMAPEQAHSIDSITPAADQYALGIIAYEMVTGRVPFIAETPLAVILKHLNDPLPMPRSLRADLPPDAERTLLKVLSKHPEQRYANCVTFAAAFAGALVNAGTIVEVEAPSPSIGMPGATPTFYDSATADYTEIETGEVGTAPAAALRAKTTAQIGQRAETVRAAGPAATPRWLWIAGGGIGVVALLVAGLVFGPGLLNSPEATAPAIAAPTEAAPESAATRPAATAASSGALLVGEITLQLTDCTGLDQPPGLCMIDYETGLMHTRIDGGESWAQITGYAFNPDGSRIVFTGTRTGFRSAVLYLIDREGGNLTPLNVAGAEASVATPDWSADGEWLLFSINNAALYRMRTDGSDLTPLLESTGVCIGNAHFAPDSLHVVASALLADCPADPPVDLALLLIAPDGSYEAVHEFSLEEDSRCRFSDLMIDPALNSLYYVDPLDDCLTSVVDIGSGELRQTASMSIPWEYTATLREVRP